MHISYSINAHTLNVKAHISSCKFKFNAKFMFDGNRIYFAKLNLDAEFSALD